VSKCVKRFSNLTWKYRRNGKTAEGASSAPKDSPPPSSVKHSPHKDSKKSQAEGRLFEKNMRRVLKLVLKAFLNSGGLISRSEWPF
jgi:hypothetical protein